MRLSREILHIIAVFTERGVGKGFSHMTRGDVDESTVRLNLGGQAPLWPGKRETICAPSLSQKVYVSISTKNPTSPVFARLERLEDRIFEIRFAFVCPEYCPD